MGSAKTRRLALAGGALAGAAWWCAAACRRVEVRGVSMAPALAPGDRLLVRRLGRSRRRLRPGDLVVVADPRAPQRTTVKRVAAPPGQGALAGGRPIAGRAGTVVVLGDNPAASSDSRSYGPVALAAVAGRVWYRYAPAERAGRLRRQRAPGPVRRCRGRARSTPGRRRAPRR